MASNLYLPHPARGVNLFRPASFPVLVESQEEGGSFPGFARPWAPRPHTCLPPHGTGGGRNFGGGVRSRLLDGDQECDGEGHRAGGAEMKAGGGEIEDRRGDRQRRSACIRPKGLAWGREGSVPPTMAAGTNDLGATGGAESACGSLDARDNRRSVACDGRKPKLSGKSRSTLDAEK